MKDLEALKSNLLTKIEKIRKKRYTSINWYNLDSEIEKIKSFPTFEEREVLLYEFQKLFIEQNKSIINAYDKDLVICKVLETIILDTPLKVGATKLKKKEYFIDSGVKNAVDKSLKVLDFYEVINQNKIALQQNRKEYTLNLNKWYERSKYRINDNEVLAVLAPIITSYINIGFINKFNIEILFEKISNLIEYAIQPSKEHNKKIALENEILYSIERKEEINIYIKKEESFGEIDILAIAIVFNKGKKYLKYKDNNTNKYYTEELNNFELEIEEEIKDINTLNDNFSMLKTEDIIKTNQTKPQTQEPIKLLLECDSIVYEYFNMLPLSNMIIYDSEDKQREFMKKYNYDCMPNKFYIEALDFTEKIISVIFHCLENVKIIEPTELNKDIIKRFKTFAKKNNIELCEEDTTPPKEPLKSNNKNDDLNLKNETSTHTNDKNVEVNKDGLVGKIKNSDIGNLDL